LQLLKQTDECLKSLGAQLVQERNKNQPIIQMNEVKKTTDSTNSLVEKYLENEHAYYTIAHKIVEPIDKQPTTLIGGKLKEYQIQGLQWMVSLYNNHLNGILADELGLGKTIQAISLIVHLMEYKNCEGPFMVIAPLSTLDNWLIEFQKWAPHVKVIKYVGNQDARRQIQSEIRKKNFHVLLIQYEYVSRDKMILKRTAFEYIIIDEGHRIKNKDAKLVADLKMYNSKYRLLLTGTPLQNDLTELWALLNFLLPHVFDKVTTFETWFNTPFVDKVQMTGEETLLIIHRLHQVLRPFLLRREKKEVESQLPEKVEKIIRCSLSAMQRKLYDQIQNKSRSLRTIKGKVKHVSLTNTVMQLRKVCNHPFLFMHEYDEFNDRDLVRSSGKVELLDRILPKLFAKNHKILIFSQMTKLLNVLEIYLGNKKYEYLRLDGNVKSELRGQLVKDWNAKDSPYKIFLLSTRAGGLGLNLQSADTVIIFDSDYNPQQDIQAMARAHRIGQTRAVRVFVLVTASPVEEKIYDVANEKRDAEAKVIKAGMFDQQSTYKQRSEMLKLIMDGNDSAFEAEIPTDEQLNKIIARGEEEEKLFHQMDKEREKFEKEYWKKLKLPVPERLMSEEELPEWLKNMDEILEQEETEKQYGKGHRDKKSLNYDLSISDEEMLDIGESDKEEEENLEEIDEDYESN
jgi:SNF2 family DNA or RNA helicase